MMLRMPRAAFDAAKVGQYRMPGLHDCVIFPGKRAKKTPGSIARPGIE
jgi:hypothetical protein